MKFTVYSATDGRVLYGGEADAPEVLTQAGEAILLDETHFNGYIVAGQHFALPAQPSPAHVFDYTSKTWVDPRTLDEVKAIKNAAIDRARGVANTSFFVFQGKQISVDPLSRSDIDAAHGAILMLQAMPPGWPGGWKAKDRTIVQIPDVATWAQFYGTMVATGTANFNHSQVLKAQLAAASTVAEVEAVPDW